MSKSAINVAVMKVGIPCKGWDMHIVEAEVQHDKSISRGVCRICEKSIAFVTGEWQHLPHASQFASMREFSNPMDWWKQLSVHWRINIMSDECSNDEFLQYADGGGTLRYFQDLPGDRQADLYKKYIDNEFLEYHRSRDDL